MTEQPENPIRSLFAAAVPVDVPRPAAGPATPLPEDWRGSLPPVAATLGELLAHAETALHAHSAYVARAVLLSDLLSVARALDTALPQARGALAGGLDLSSPAAYDALRALVTAVDAAVAALDG